jgi:hypothetical protein
MSNVGVTAKRLIDEALASGGAEKPAAQAKRQEPTVICQPAYMSGLRVLTGAELLKLDLPARDLLLSPWLPAKGLRRTTDGTPQGGVISPLLANIYLHHVLDEMVRARCATAAQRAVPTGPIR